MKIDTVETSRGSIYDRNGKLLAGEGKILNIGLVPGKMRKNNENDINEIARLLEIKPEKIKSALNASYVKEDTFVSIANISENDKYVEKELLKIAGIKIKTLNGRTYPYAEQTSHLIGYVQTITPEELEANFGKGYSSSSIIGKTGLEKSYEDKLRGLNGYEIYIADNKGNKKKTIIAREARKGEDVKLTIDINIQKSVYAQFKEDESATVVLNPKTGEILAMCSTPSYDANKFVLGMNDEEWQTIVSDQKEPLYNRCQAVWVPGSSIKPIIGAIGLTTNTITADEDFRNKWKKMAKRFYLGNI